MCFDLVSFLFLRLQVSLLLHLSSSFWVFNPASSTGTLLFVTFIVTGWFVSLLFAHNKGAVLAAKSPFLSDFVTAGVNLLKQFPSAVPFNEGLAREQAYAKSTADNFLANTLDSQFTTSSATPDTDNEDLTIIFHMWEIHCRTLIGLPPQSSILDSASTGVMFSAVNKAIRVSTTKHENEVGFHRFSQGS